MRIKKKKFLFIFFLIVMIPLAFAERQLVDRVIAVVNDSVITLAEFDQLFRPVAEQYQHTYHGQELAEKLIQARRELLTRLIDNQLILQEAKRLGILVSEDDVDKRLKEFKKNFQSESDFENLLKTQQIRMATFRKQLHDEIAIQRLRYLEVQQKVVVTPLEIKAYYDRHADTFAEKEQVEVWSITIRKNEESIRKGTMDQRAKARAESLLQQLKKGADFSSLAKAESEDPHAKDGGRIGYVSRGDLIPEFDEVLFRLAPHELSGVLETEEAYHIFKAGPHREGRMRTLDEVREQINDILFQEKAKARFHDWVKELKKKAYISIR